MSRFPILNILKPDSLSAGDMRSYSMYRGYDGSSISNATVLP